MKPLRKRLQSGYLIFLLLILFPVSAGSQVLSGFESSVADGIMVEQLSVTGGPPITIGKGRPLFSFLLDKRLRNTSGAVYKRTGDTWSQVFDNVLKVTTTLIRDSVSPFRLEIVFENTGTDTVSVSNVVPFGTDSISSVHITGRGPWDLARAWLCRPGYRPVRVILPDNAWELGYTSFSVSGDVSVCGLARRSKWIDGAQRARYETLLPPKGKVYYNLYAETYRGEWQNGLRLMFRDRYLHDVGKFDNSLYTRADLSWIKQSYLIILQMAWDREFYDRLTGKYNFAEVIKKGISQFGKIDVYGIWPTWPRLGLDQRNQWDLYRDLPGGTKQLRNFADMSQQAGTRFFIAFNPWDKSTREEDHFRGMARMIAETDADGVVLDTQGSSSYELQAAADSVRKGVVMYSEGMAVTKDMPGIISGRVHNAIYYSPELNLNKLIKPDFSIFRVCDVGEDLIHRELAVSFFNGYGTELNMYRPGGRDDFYRQDMDYLARTTFTLRQNNDAFLDYDWTPFIETRTDNVFVNKWSSGEKVVFTVLNMKPEGINGPLFKGEKKEGRHWVSLWNHEELKPVAEKEALWIPAKAEGWHSSYKGTRHEGSVDCIAEFPILLKPVLRGDSLKINGTGTNKLLLWKGNPSYAIQPKEMRIKNDTVLKMRELFGFYEGKIVLQLLENNILRDETILELPGGKPWLISKITSTDRAVSVPENMVIVPGAVFSYHVTANDEFMPYPDVNDKMVKVDSFLIDRYPVTNDEYHEFLMSSGYRPADTARFLRHWVNGMYKQGQEKYPVVNLSYEDMNAYAKWAGKRLPSEAEWQLAAQGTDKRVWPWGNEFHGAFCNNSFGRPTPVDAFPKGQSPSGAKDLVGNVWQMTNDMYFNGSYYLTVIRGGSYYKPESSWWYIQGGPQSLDKTQILLMVSPGFDRSSTVGFRCVKDIDKKNFLKKK
ncbi:MAG: formylglycine-generating enzyme family protein [Chloroflexota bacterium]